MHSVDTEFLRLFRKSIDDRKLELIERLVNGGNVKDFTEYRFCVGQMRALEFALIAAAEINDTLMGVTRNKVA